MIKIAFPQKITLFSNSLDMGSFIIMNLTEILYRAPLKIQSAKQNEARAKKCCDVIWIFRGALQIFSVDRKISYKATKKLAQIPKSRCLLSCRNTKKKPKFIRNINIIYWYYEYLTYYTNSNWLYFNAALPSHFI